VHSDFPNALYITIMEKHNFRASRQVTELCFKLKKKTSTSKKARHCNWKEYHWGGTVKMNCQPHADLGPRVWNLWLAPLGQSWWPRSLLSRLQTFQTTSSEGVLCDKYGVTTLENECVCMAVCLQRGKWNKKRPHIRITMTAFLAQDLSWNIYSRQVGKFSAVMEPEF